MKNKVAIYCRVSTDTQNTQLQSDKLINYAKQKGWDFELFEEVESSRKSRPIKANMLQRLRAKEFDAVLVYKLDRFARSSTELIIEINELVNKGVGFISITDNLDFSTAAGQLHFTILSAFASFERELIRERTLEGIAMAKKNGKTLGRPKGAKDKKTRKKSGYYLRAAKEKQALDIAKGVNKELTAYI